MATERPVDLNIAEQLRTDEEFRKHFFRAVAQNEVASQRDSLQYEIESLLYQQASKVAVKP